MIEVFVGIGSNHHRQRRLTAGLLALGNHFGSLTLSSVYESEAIRQGTGRFYNMVASFNTELDISSVCGIFRQIEAQQGRLRNSDQGGCYPLDLDLLLYGDLCGCANGRQIPHRDLLSYAFVLQPMAEIAGERICPGTDQTFSGLWRSLSPVLGKLEPIVNPGNMSLVSGGKSPEMIERDHELTYHSVGLG